MPGGRQVTLPLDEKVDHVRGAPAGHLIIEYGDYECPYSRQAFHAIEQVAPNPQGKAASKCFHGKNVPKKTSIENAAAIHISGCHEIVKLP